MWRIVLLFCAGIASATVWAQRVERVSYKGWQDCYRLSNGTVEVVVVPSVARIMHYGFFGEPNVLWVNPATEGVPVKPGEWPNHGGDKAWVCRRTSGGRVWAGGGLPLLRPIRYPIR